MSTLETGLRVSSSAIAINIILAVIKISAGIIGNSYALIADGIESTMDIFSSLIVWGGLRISQKPPDQDHPYGHGRAESMAGVAVALALIGAAILIAVQSIREIRTPHHAPAWYTLFILVLIILVKEVLFRKMTRIGEDLESSSLKNDAWHHRSDALTSMAALIGISVSLLGGEGYETADDWAALLACGLICYNGVRLLLPSINEIMDAAAPEEIHNQVRRTAKEVPGVIDIDKCRIRKSGLNLLMDIHIIVDGGLSVREGHRIGHEVKDHLLASNPKIQDVILHVEPDTFNPDQENRPGGA